MTVPAPTATDRTFFFCFAWGLGALSAFCLTWFALGADGRWIALFSGCCFTFCSLSFLAAMRTSKDSR